MFANAEEDIENLIDIVTANGKVIAIIRGTRVKPVDLLRREKVLWTEARGNLGAFLTDSRFFVISTTSPDWRILRLKLDESADKSIAVVSPYVAVLITENRAIGFNGSYNRFIEIRLPLKDELLTVKSGDYVAVVITTSRVYGLAANSSSFIEARLRVTETVEEVKVSSSKVIVRTSDRLLSFVVNSSTWREYRLDLI
jgi:hypothetical protein